MPSVLATIAKLLPRTHTLALLRYAVVDLVLTVLSIRGFSRSAVR